MEAYTVVGQHVPQCNVVKLRVSLTRIDEYLAHLSASEQMLLPGMEECDQVLAALEEAARKGVIEEALMEIRIVTPVHNQDVLRGHCLGIFFILADNFSGRG